MNYWHGRSRLVTRPGAVPLFVVLLVVGTANWLAGCASEPIVSSSTEEVGSLGFNLAVAQGITLNSVSYTVSKDDFTNTGAIDVSDSPTISETIGGIPAGDGYTITLTTTPVEDETTFTGSATFDVTAGETTSVTIQLKRTGTNGNVTVNATLDVAPVIDELSVTPKRVFAGGSVTLKATGRDPVTGPSPLTYYWSTSEGVIDNPIARNATLTGTSPGTAAVTLTISDGESSVSASTTITFVERGTGGSGSSAGPQRPNILLIIADDVGAESLSLYPDLVGDHGAAPTPNLEALAQKGLVFDHVWASPVCSPTRSTIVTGLYGHRSGVTYVHDVLPTDIVTVFDRITAESPSYGQAFFGKYHLAGHRPTSAQHVADIGVPTFRGILSAAVTDYYHWTTYDTQAPPYTNTTYATTAITGFAVDYIHEHEATRPDDPWFVYQAYNASHAPRQVPPAELHSIDLGDAEPGRVLNTLQNYKAITQSLDTSIGTLLAEVDLEKTTVIFIGDNGTPADVKDRRAGVKGSKGSVYEGGVHVPLIVAGAGVTRRGREDALVSSVDLYATILSLAGLPASHVNDSYSVKQLLSDEAAASGRTHLFTESTNNTFKIHRYAIRDSRYKLASIQGVRELYDLIDDPLETTDLYSSAAHRAVRAALEAEIAALAPQAPAGYFP